MEVMELSDLHHPNCKINRKLNSGGGLGGIDSCRRESESSDSILLSPEASKATEAVEFIAEHLKNEDSYIQVGSVQTRQRFQSRFQVSVVYSDSRGLEVCGDGHRSTPALHILHCDNRRDCWNSNGRPTYIRIRRSGQNYRNLSWKVI